MNRTTRSPAAVLAVAAAAVAAACAHAGESEPSPPPPASPPASATPDPQPAASPASDADDPPAPPAPPEDPEPAVPEEIPPPPKEPGPQEPAVPAPPRAADDPAEKAAAVPPAAPGRAPSDAPAAPPADPAPTAEQDAAARKVLVLAAERQGGAPLAAPAGSVESFRVVFGKVTLHRAETDASGVVTRRRMDSEDPGLVVHWKRGQIRTEMRLTGERATTRGVLLRAKGEAVQEIAWLDDGGEKPTMLVGEKWTKDRDEIERDRRVIRSLLDVAVLRGLLADGSRWQVVEDSLHPGVALRRTPPAGADGALRITLWIDPATHDVTAARLPPGAEGEPTLHYEFEYDDEFPQVKDRVLRFPFRFTVKEQRPGAKDPEPVMVAMAREASFNDVDDTVFLPPKR